MQQLLSEVLKAQVGNWATSSGGELTYFHVMPPRVVAKVRSYATPPQLRAAFQQRFRGRYKDFKLLVETEDDFGEGFRALYDEMTTDGFREWQTQSEFLGA